MNVATVSARELLRDQAGVIKRIQETRQPLVLVNREEPQIALVSLSDLDELAMLKRREALKKLVELSARIAEEHKTNPLPTDVSVNHNQYFYEAWEEAHKSSI